MSLLVLVLLSLAILLQIASIILLIVVLRNLTTNFGKEDKQMSALSDIVQQVVDDQKKMATDTESILKLLTQPEPDVEAAITALMAVKASQDNSISAMEAALPKTSE